MTTTNAAPLCPNCYPAWPEKPVLVDDDGRCLACGRFYTGSWKDNSFDINHRERNHHAHRIQKLLGQYRNLIDLGSNAAPFVLNDVADTLKALEKLETERVPRYTDNAPVIPDKEKSPEHLAFEAYWLERNAVSPFGEPADSRSEAGMATASAEPAEGPQESSAAT